MLKKIAELIVVTNAFRLLVCLGPMPMYCDNCGETGRHKRLSAFGMSWTYGERMEFEDFELMVTNAFRLLVCLGLGQSQVEEQGGQREVTNAFRLLVCLGRTPDAGMTLYEIAGPSQTPFGFWYVLDGNMLPVEPKYTVAHVSQTPFGFWYVLDMGGHGSMSKLPRWSQTPFGFWYVLDKSSALRTPLGLALSQTPFGFWYVLDKGTS